MTEDVKHFFLHWLDIGMSSSVKCIYDKICLFFQIGL